MYKTLQMPTVFVIYQREMIYKTNLPFKKPVGLIFTEVV